MSALIFILLIAGIVLGAILQHWIIRSQDHSQEKKLWNGGKSILGDHPWQRTIIIPDVGRVYTTGKPDTEHHRTILITFSDIDIEYVEPAEGKD